MTRSQRAANTFPSVTIDLLELGASIRIARKRRKKTMADVAERLNLGYQTIVRIEKGDPAVSMSAYMSVLWLFDLDRQWVEAIHPDKDQAGKSLELMRLPQRVVHKRGESDNDF
jgi:transcriptional regulator with XRE-family HTH domain